MNIRNVVIIWAGALALPALAVLPASRFVVGYAGARSPYESRVNLAEPERERIQRHLAAVEADLRLNPPAGLSQAQREARAARLDDLHAYWTRGEFPINRDYPERLVPYFIDADGVPCAMGYLVIRSGHAAFADEIRKNRNNAYIGEISAVDGRLSAWAAANGMTLDEAARVQPAYGPPRLANALRVRLDSLERPWVFGADQNAVGGTALFHRSADSGWKLDASVYFGSGFCLTRDGNAAVMGYPGVDWKQRSYAIPAPSPINDPCAWGAQDRDLWVGTKQGLWRFTRTGTADTLAVTRFTTPLASDTVIAVAVAGTTVWAAGPRGVYRRVVQGQDTGVTVWDSAALGGRVTSLKSAGGAKVWAGLEAPHNSGKFSTRGFALWNGTQWRVFFTGLSSVQVPSDTLQALATRDTASAWIATASGFHRFTGSGLTPKVANVPSGIIVYDLAGDGPDRFYAATNQGVYHFRNDSLVLLEMPNVGLRPGVAGKRPSPQRGLRVLTRAQAAHAAETGRLRSVLGRQAPAGAAQGVYVPESADPR